MNRYRIVPRRSVMTLILLATVMSLLGGCFGPRAKQGEVSRIPDTSNKLTAAAPAGSLPGSAGQKIASPSPVGLSSQTVKQPTQAATLKAVPTKTPRPTSTVTPQVMKVDPACLVGSWQVADLPGAMSHSYAQSGTTIQLQGVKGQATYVFDAKGGLTIAFDHLAATFTGTLDNRDVTVLQGLDGSGSAHYQVNPMEGQMILSEFGGQGVLSTLDINGQRLAEGNIPVWQAFTSSLSSDAAAPNALVDYSRVSVACQSDSMTIQAVEPVPGPPVRLTREK